jgi:hypothetical protein
MRLVRLPRSRERPLVARCFRSARREAVLHRPADQLSPVPLCDRAPHKSNTWTEVHTGDAPPFRNGSTTYPLSKAQCCIDKSRIHFQQSPSRNSRSHEATANPRQFKHLMPVRLVVKDQSAIRRLGRQTEQHKSWTALGGLGRSRRPERRNCQLTGKAWFIPILRRTEVSDAAQIRIDEITGAIIFLGQEHSFKEERGVASEWVACSAGEAA